MSVIVFGKTVAPIEAIQPTVEIDKIRVDGGTQSRADINQVTVDEYASAIAEGVEFPPVVVFYDGSDRWLADGFHRYRAHVQLGLAEIAADVRQGTRRDAILYSVGANETHGLRRSNEDKRRAVLTLLNDADWSKWSDREIGRRCMVGYTLVAKLRPELTARAGSERTYTTKHGTTATMNTAAIGKSETVSLLDDEDEEILREARELADQAKEDEGQAALDYLLENIEADDMQAAEAPQQAAKSGRLKTQMVVPDGKNIVDLCREGLRLEAGGLTSDQAAAQIGIARRAYGLCRQIVYLADNPDLGPRDKALAQKALSVLTSTLHVNGASEIVEPLAERVWGKGNRYALINIPAKRVEQFELAFGIIMQACMTTSEIELPQLSAERVKKAIQEIGKARGALERFAVRIRDIQG